MKEEKGMYTHTHTDKDRHESLQSPPGISLICQDAQRSLLRGCVCLSLLTTLRKYYSMTNIYVQKKKRNQVSVNVYRSTLQVRSSGSE